MGAVMKTVNTMDCTTCRTLMPDLLLEPQALPGSEVTAHLAACPACSEELAELQATMLLLDEWTAPEPSPYFDARVRAHLSAEAEAASPATAWQRLLAVLHLSTGHGLRPALAGAFVFLLLLGGGTAATLWGHHAAAPAAQSPMVKDLQIDDNNAQALQQLDLLDDQGSQGSSVAPQS